jgi:hypothetical protein
MRDLDTIDSELRLLAAVRWSIREHSGEPSSRHVDELLDERVARRARRAGGWPEPEQTSVPAGRNTPCVEIRPAWDRRRLQ